MSKITNSNGDFIEVCEDGIWVERQPEAYEEFSTHVYLDWGDGLSSRALLAHLLEAEGLPGVEEDDIRYIEDVRGSVLQDPCEAVVKDMLAIIDRLVVNLFNTRQARLVELLEAEARDCGIRSQLVVNSDGQGAFSVQVHGGDEFGSHHISRTFYPHDGEDFIDQDCWIGMLMEFEARSAALAEKRRRESEVVDG